MDSEITIHGILKLIVVQARVCRNLDYFSDQDPYFILKYFCLDRDEYQKHSLKDKLLFEKEDGNFMSTSKVIDYGGMEPVWNHKVDIPLEYTLEPVGNEWNPERTKKHFITISMYD